jgi:hypothetical protein
VETDAHNQGKRNLPCRRLSNLVKSNHPVIPKVEVKKKKEKQAKTP